MDERYNLLARVGVRQLREYNRLSIERFVSATSPKPTRNGNRFRKALAIVVIADEMADMMAIAGKDVHEFVARLAQRAVPSEST